MCQFICARVNTQRYGDPPGRHDPNNQRGVIETCGVKESNPFLVERLSAIEEASNNTVNAHAKGRITQYLIPVDKGSPIVTVH
jgi:hypothetical protein